MEGEPGMVFRCERSSVLLFNREKRLFLRTDGVALTVRLFLPYDVVDVRFRK